MSLGIYHILIILELKKLNYNPYELPASLELIQKAII